jgi:hypothetical protein
VDAANGFVQAVGHPAGSIAKGVGTRLSIRNLIFSKVLWR